MDPGISESERQRRKESNRISTKINFAAWLIEVPYSFNASQLSDTKEDAKLFLFGPFGLRENAVQSFTVSL